MIYPRLGAKNKKILVGPAAGVDTCVIRSGKNQVLVATTDPVSYIPDIGLRYSAWQSVNHIASDLATSRFSPQYAIFDFNLPPTMKSSDFEKYWEAVSAECERLGTAIVGGHTGRFEGVDSTVVGVGTMFSLGPEDECLTSREGKVGDKLLITKGAAISTTAILAYAFPKTLEKKMGRDGLLRARRYLRKTTVVKDELTVVKIGIKNNGVSTMHDATEGGVLSALYELADASNTGLMVDLSKIPVSRETSAICEVFKIDPYVSLSEGSLVFSCKPSKVAKAISTLASVGIETAEVGELIPRREGFLANDATGKQISIKYPAVDPYWQAYYGGKRRGWT